MRHAFKYLKIIAVISISAFTIYSCSSLPMIVEFPNGWIEKSPPILQSIEWANANYCYEACRISLKDTNIFITLFEPKRDTLRYYIPGEGHFIATDHGEWGGWLDFVPVTQPESLYQVMSGNIRYIFKIKGDLYCLYHYGGMYGSMCKLEKANGRWISSDALYFGKPFDTPKIFAITEDNELYVVTSTRLLYISSEWLLKAIVDSIFWWNGLAPNSMVIINNTAIIGMCGGITKVDFISKKISWFVRKQPKVWIQ